MEIDAGFLALGSAAAILAGISKGGFGSGAAFAAAALLMLIMEPGAALGVMMPLLILIDVVSLGPYWRRWDTRAAQRLTLSGLVGVALGAAFLAAAAPGQLKLAIGLVALGFLVWQFALWRGLVSIGHTGLPGWSVWPLGAAAGFTSFVAHAGGPLTAIYLLSKRPEKTVYQATTVIVFGVLNLAKIGPYVALGLVTPEIAKATFWLFPAALLGTWLGVRMHAAIPQRAFFAVTYGLLGVTGVKLIADALV